MKNLIAATLLGLGSLQAQLNQSEETLMKEILPSEDELAWQEIDWKIDLWEARVEARVEAAKIGKPIYLWEMDGHPLGCAKT
ncbi:hypothetical protein N9891_01960 [bacterium]|nr:hypothetical protein [bacterium]